MAAIIIGAMLNRAYIVIGVSSWNEGCKEASMKMGMVYGLQYQGYLDKFCNARLNHMNEEFQLED